MPKLRGDLPRNGPGRSAESRRDAGVLLRKHPAEQRTLKAAISRRRARALSGASVQSTDEQVSVCARPAAWGTCARTRGRTKRSERERIRCGVLTAVGSSSQVLDITYILFFCCMRSYQHQHAEAGALSPFTMSSLYKPIIEVVWRRC